MLFRRSWRAAGGALLVTLAACGREAGPAPAADTHDEPAAPITNRIDIPPAVRKNLGITFSRVESRAVQATTRIPGHFELLPTAHRAYAATLPGQVELVVAQYQTVKKGDVLFRVESAAWHEMQAELASTVNAIRKAHAELGGLDARLVAVRGHAEGLRAQRDVWKERLAQIAGIGAAGGGIASAKTEARVALAAAETSIAEVAEEEAELIGAAAALRAELQGHEESTPLLYAHAMRAPLPTDSSARLDLAMARAAALLGVTVDVLCAPVEGVQVLPRWRAIDRLEVVATEPGVVEALDVVDGAWIETGQTVLETVDPSRLRFRAVGLQADLGRMADGMPGTVLPPGGSAASADQGVPGAIHIALEADPLARKIDILLDPAIAELPAWARLGVSTELEIVLLGGDEPELAIPLQSVIQDGLHKVFFRRDPKNADKAIRIEADLGRSDGKWVVVESGVMEGDEVVHDGIYELMLASGGAAKATGGHFHADGTWHEGSDH